MNADRHNSRLCTAREVTRRDQFDEVRECETVEELGKRCSPVFAHY